MVPRVRPGRSGVPWRRARSEGQALAELALITPILLLILTATAQFGTILATQVGIVNAVREAAREAAAVPTTTADAAAANGAWAHARLVDDLLPGAASFQVTRLDPGVGGTDVCYRPATGAGGATDVRVDVRAAYLHPIWLPFAGGLIDAIDGTPDGALRLEADADMRVENVGPASLDAEVCAP